MKFLFLLVALATASFLVSASKLSKASIVEDLTGVVDLTAWLKSHPIAAVMFYSPRNPLSQDQLSMFNSYGTGFKKSISDLTFAKIDCTNGVSKKVCLSYVDDGLPTVPVFRDGHPWSRELNPAFHPRDEQDQFVANMAKSLNPTSNYDAEAVIADFGPVMKAIYKLTGLYNERQEEAKYPVKDITGVDFSAWLKRNPVALVMFYSPMGLNSRTLLPFYGTFAAELKKRNTKFTAVKIDCTAESSKEACLPYFESGSPTFLVFKNGQARPEAKNPINMANRVREEERIWMRLAEEKGNPNFVMEVFNAPFMVDLRKATADLTVVLTVKDAEPEKYIVDLTGADFTAWRTSHSVAVVAFYAPWSESSKKLMPFIGDAAEHIKKQAAHVVFAKIDCTTTGMTAVCDEYVDQVNGYPTIKVFYEGDPWERTDGYDWKANAAENMEEEDAALAAPLSKALSDLAALLELQAKQTADAVTVVDLTGVDFSAWLKTHPIALVMFYEPSAKKLLPIFGGFVSIFKERDPDAVLAKIECTGKSKKICDKYADSKLPAFTVFRDGLVYTNTYETETSIHEDHWKQRLSSADAKVGGGQFDAQASAPLLKAVANLVALLEERHDVVVDLSSVKAFVGLQKHTVALVMFYDPRNSQSRKLLPHYHKEARTILKTFPDAVMAKVDCTVTEMKKICAKYVEAGSPTFTVFHEGKLWETDIDEIVKSLVKDGQERIGAQYEQGFLNEKFAAPLKDALLRLSMAMYYVHGSRPKEEL